MDETLDLRPLASRLPLDRPFTPGIARAAGLERSTLDRLHRAGLVSRVLRGVYAATGAPDTVGFRAAALALVVRRDTVVVDRTAAWLHGVDVRDRSARGEPVPIDRVSRSHRDAAGARLLTGRDVVVIEGVRVTTPLRTALDLGRLLPAGRALGAIDALLGTGSFSHTQLLAELSRMAGCRGIGQLRLLAPQADARAAGTAESVLRLHWNEARLPTPVPGAPVVAAGRLVRLALAVDRRQFGAVLLERVTADDLVALEGAGWRVVVLPEDRVLNGDPVSWTKHLEREFHQQLLAQTG
jgi:hypothetical protein